ncbi:MAG: HDOD domain-containing protein, partial [Pseudomonadota bacterium]|nr:HDOD domain-containing protein [Pseudomonadota bacterium]
MTPALQKRLAHCTALPSLPGVAMRIIQMGQDPEADPGTIARIIGQDPALAAKLLRIANSPLYARRRRVDNLTQAVLLLGINATVTLALSFTLVGALHARPSRALDYSRYWRRSLLAAIASRVLGQRLGVGFCEELFLAGLLQDIGMLVLDTVMAEDYATVLAAAADPAALAERERQMLGADHAEVGAWIMGRWHLPDYLQRAVARSEMAGDGADAEVFERCVA